MLSRSFRTRPSRWQMTWPLRSGRLQRRMDQSFSLVTSMVASSSRKLATTPKWPLSRVRYDSGLQEAIKDGCRDGRYSDALCPLDHHHYCRRNPSWTRKRLKDSDL